MNKKTKFKKGWKKTRVWKTGVTYSYITSFGSTFSFIQVYKSESHNPQWRFTYHSGGRIREEGLFKTKGQALRFAKNYMRKHPNG